jgi:hypothetical protein
MRKEVYTFLKLGKNIVYIGLWEGFGLSLHIFVGISIGTNNLESPCTNDNTGPNPTICLTVLLSSNWVFIPGPLKEFSLHHPRVSLRSLIHLDCVIPAVER